MNKRHGPWWWMIVPVWLDRWQGSSFRPTKELARREAKRLRRVFNKKKGAKHGQA